MTTLTASTILWLWIVLAAVAFIIVGLIVGYVAGWSRGFDYGYEDGHDAGVDERNKLPFINAPELDFRNVVEYESTGRVPRHLHFTSLETPPTWVSDAPRKEAA